jgi:hypothetical protein
MKTQINIFNNDLEWVGMVDSIHHLVHRTSWHEISKSTMTVSKKANGVEHLQIGRILVVNNRLDKALIIEEMEASLDDEYWNFLLIPLKGILNYRVALPTESAAYNNHRQSAAMRNIVRDNTVTTTNASRHFVNSKGVRIFQMAPIKQFGDTISFSVDWETGQLGDTVTAIAKMYGVAANYPLGWNIYIVDDFSAIEFDVWHGNHRTINQTTNPPVVFSEEFGNLKDANYMFSVRNWKNYGYIEWHDANDNRGIVEVKRENHGQTIGFNRREMVYNSDKRTRDEATSQGQFEVNKRPHVESFTAEIVNNPRTMSTFEKDWFLGDIVTIQSKEILKGKTLSIDTQVTEIEEIYDSGLYSINASFGQPKLTIFEMIRNDLHKGG